MALTVTGSHLPPSIKTLDSDKFAAGKVFSEGSSAARMQDGVHFNSFGQKSFQQLNFWQKIWCLLTGSPAMKTAADFSEAAKLLNCLRPQEPEGAWQRFSANFEDGSSFSISYKDFIIDAEVQMICQDNPSAIPVMQKLTGDEARQIIAHLPVSIYNNRVPDTAAQPGSLPPPALCQTGSHTTVVHSIPQGMETLDMANIAMNLSTVMFFLPDKMENAQPAFHNMLEEACREMESGENRLTFLGADMPKEYLAMLSEKIREEMEVANKVVDEVANEIEDEVIEDEVVDEGEDEGEETIPKSDELLVSDTDIDRIFKKVGKQYRETHPNDPPLVLDIIEHFNSNRPAQWALIASMSQGMLSGQGEGQKAWRGDVADGALPITVNKDDGSISVMRDIRKFEVTYTENKHDYHITSTCVTPFMGDKVYMEVTRGEMNVPNNYGYTMRSYNMQGTNGLTASSAIVAVE